MERILQGTDQPTYRNIYEELEPIKIEEDNEKQEITKEGLEEIIKKKQWGSTGMRKSSI